jgi:hypothetical protein
MAQVSLSHVVRDFPVLKKRLNGVSQGMRVYLKLIFGKWPTEIPKPRIQRAKQTLHPARRERATISIR